MLNISAQFNDEQPDEVLLRFDICDTGIGITPAFRKQIFTAFAQQDSSVIRQYGGTGLGLVISKNLAVLMRGELDFESEENKGSVFWFTVRLMQSNEQEVIQFQQATTTQALQDSIPQYAARLLLVEDNYVNQEVALRTLQLFGCEVDIVENGQEALDLLKRREKSYHLIFMDCEMPIMDGYFATRQIRQWEKDNTMPACPIIALTAHASLSSRKKVLNVGMNDFLSKPFRLDQFHKILGQWLPVETQCGYLHITLETAPGTMAHAMSDQAIEDNSENYSSHLNILSYDALNQLRALEQGGHSGLLQQMVEHFLGQAPVLLKQIQENIVSKDLEIIRKTAHKLRSSSATLGALKLAELCDDIELNFDNIEFVTNRLRVANTVYSNTQQALRNYLMTEQDAGVSL